MGSENHLEERMMDYETFRKICPDNFGRINCQQAFDLANKRNDKSFTHVVCMVCDAESPSHPDDSLDCYKNLVHLLKRIMNTNGEPDRLQTLYRIYSEKKEFPKKHSDLYIKILNLALLPGIGPKLVKVLPENFVFKTSKKEIMQDLQRHDSRFCYGATHEMSESAEIILSAIMDDLGEKCKADFRNVSDEVRSALKALEGEIDDDYLRRFPYFILRARDARFPAETALLNDVGCCITGTDGKWREASIIYDIDKAVKLWKIGPTEESFKPFALGIFVETEGYHVSNPDDRKKYLVFEGFPANQAYYDQIHKVTMILSTHNSEFISYEKEFSLSELGYMIGLIAAKKSNIPKLFVNTEHSGRQDSVEKTVGEIAQSAGLARGTVWKYDRHGRFKLLMDPYTGGEFLNKVGNQQFEHTHFLKKPQLDSDIVEKLRKDPEWGGESVFDTFYDWNKFIMETHPQWSEELKKQHPYAESVLRRGKDPQWNLGIGYCKGFEVDVEKECERLGIS